MFDKQEVFNFVAEKIIQQGRPSFDPIKDRCFYRYYDEESKTMCKCAIGHLITDNDYDKFLDESGKGARYICNNAKINLILVGKIEHNDEIEFLAFLQRCHDIAARAASAASKDFVKEFKMNMREFAYEYYLDRSILNMNGETTNV